MNEEEEVNHQIGLDLSERFLTRLLFGRYMDREEKRRHRNHENLRMLRLRMGDLEEQVRVQMELIRDLRRSAHSVQLVLEREVNPTPTMEIRMTRDQQGSLNIERSE